MQLDRLRPPLARAALVLVVLTSACGTGTPADQAQPAPNGALPSASPSISPPASPTSAAPSPAASNTISVTYAGGNITGDTGRIKVKAGEGVTINITSDVADEVHRTATTSGSRSRPRRGRR